MSESWVHWGVDTVTVITAWRFKKKKNPKTFDYFHNQFPFKSNERKLILYNNLVSIQDGSEENRKHVLFNHNLPVYPLEIKNLPRRRDK